MNVKEGAFHWAEDYCQHGLNVIPCAAGTKRPAVFWERYQAVKSTMEEIKHWFRTMAQKNFGVGIVTGKMSDLTVVDFEKEGLDLAREFWSEHQTPLISKTGGGGVHLCYRYAPYGNRVKVGGKPVDVRSDGGFLVVPPTQHPTGSQYEWVDWPVDMDQVPQFDADWLPKQAAPDPAYAPIDAEEGTKRARNYISRIFAVSGQKGHNATFRAACALRDRGINPALALSLMLDWNQSNCDPPWTVAEIRHKLDDAFRQAMELVAAQDGCRGGACDLGGQMW